MDFYTRQCLKKLYVQKTDPGFIEYLHGLGRMQGRIVCLTSSGSYAEAEEMSESLRISSQLTDEERRRLPKKIRISDMVKGIQGRVDDINRRARGNRLIFWIAEL